MRNENILLNSLKKDFLSLSEKKFDNDLDNEKFIIDTLENIKTKVNQIKRNIHHDFEDLHNKSTFESTFYEKSMNY